MDNNLDKETNDKLTYYTILYDRAVVALNVYEYNKVDQSVIDCQRHRVEQAKRDLELFKEAINT